MPCQGAEETHFPIPEIPQTFIGQATGNKYSKAELACLLQELQVETRQKHFQAFVDIMLFYFALFFLGILSRERYGISKPIGRKGQCFIYFFFKPFLYVWNSSGCHGHGLAPSAFLYSTTLTDRVPKIRVEHICPPHQRKLNLRKPFT